MVIYVVVERYQGTVTVLAAHKERTAANREVASYMCNDAENWLKTDPNNVEAANLRDLCIEWLGTNPQPPVEQLYLAWTDTGDEASVDVHEVTLR